MSKEDFLTILEHGLASLPPEERQEALRYYREYIEDGVEAGRSEEEVVASLDPPGELSLKLCREAAFSRAAKRPTPRNTWRALAAVFGVLSLPVTLPVALCLVVAALCVLIAAAAVIISVGAVIAAAVAAAIVMGVRAIWMLGAGLLTGSAAVFTVGLALCGLAVTIFAVIALSYVIYGIWRGVGQFFRWLGAAVRKIAGKARKGGENA